MSVDPHGLLAHVHPDLVKVITAAAQAPQPFQVDYGLRTLSAEQAAVASGHSETLHSRHLPDARYGGVAMAVDVIALNNDARGGIFATGHESDVFGQIADQIQAASDTLKVDLQWGGDPVGAWRDGQVSGFRDWGHFQLDPNSYPA
jgi:peptidoglycan L-alanyl-D-glutamate endopeptidase CwlK